MDEQPPKVGWFRKMAEGLYKAFTSPLNTAISMVVILLLLSFIAVDALAHHI